MTAAQILQALFSHWLQVAFLAGLALPLPWLLRIKRPDIRLYFFQALLLLCLVVPWLPGTALSPGAEPLLSELRVEFFVDGRGEEGNPSLVYPALLTLLAGLTFVALGRLFLGFSFSIGTGALPPFSSPCRPGFRTFGIGWDSVRSSESPGN